VNIYELWGKMGSSILDISRSNSWDGLEGDIEQCNDATYLIIGLDYMTAIYR
jgi:hypothetical protein